MNYIDTHAHLMDPMYGDADELIRNFSQCGIELANAVGSDLTTSRQAVELAARFPAVYAVVGVHPEGAAQYTEETERKIEELSKSAKVVAIGEIGLDYHYDYPPDMQKRAFLSQLDVAERRKLPVVLHVRDAYGDALEILKARGSGLRGVMHCYSGSAEMIESFLKLGLYLSFSGSVTFKNNRKADDCIRAVPKNRILTETDCPYLAPQPHRGELNYPGYVRFVAEKICQVYGISGEELYGHVRQNVRDLFGV